MSVNSIGSANKNPAMESTYMEKKEQGNHEESSKINKLNAEIKQGQSDIKNTMKEVQKATAESGGRASEKAQMLQNKIAMQQQSIMTKQMQIKELEAPTKSASEQSMSNAQPRFDKFTSSDNESKDTDNVYRLEEKDGTRKIIFNRPQE